MMGFTKKLKIPTILGLGIIILGIVAGVYLNLKEQVFPSQAAADLTPQNITIANITDDSAVISWQTSSASTSFITFGQGSPAEQTVLEDADNTSAAAGPKSRLIHYVTLKNLLPKTSYQFKVISGKTSSGVEKFQTGQPLTNQAGFTPIIGSVLDGNNPLKDGIVYLSLPEAITQSALIKTGGNFLIPLSQIRKNDLSDYQLTEGITAKLTVRSDKGEASMLFKLKASSAPFPPVKIGQNIDLTIPEETPQPTPASKDSDKYDLNGDGAINAADYAILAACFGKRLSTTLPGNIPCAKANLNEDNSVNQKDLDLMNQKFKELGVPAISLP